jgi:hypothetical protein
MQPLNVSDCSFIMLDKVDRQAALALDSMIMNGKTCGEWRRRADSAYERGRAQKTAKDRRNGVKGEG